MSAGKPRVITLSGGETQVPSVFAIDEAGNEIVGSAARDQASENPQGTVIAAKRLIGRNFHSKSINDTRQVFTYEMVEGADDSVLLNVAEQLYTLEQISAAILTRIKDVAEANLRAPVQQAVITVPAYFNEKQRASVRTAGRMAGFEVRILNEPTAAALVYGLGKRLNKRIAVYDLGGGTFDISIIDIQGRVYEVIATGGDTFLGGVDFDDRLMKFVLEDFHAKHGVDLSFDRVAIQRIRDAAEATKIALSSHDQAHIQLDAIHGEGANVLNVDVLITREKLEELTADLVRRTIETCQRIFEEAGCLPHEIDEFLMVGGQSRMPLVHKAVRELTGKRPNPQLDPEHAVGLGAAIMAQAVRKPSSSSVTLRDVLPIPIGIRGAENKMHVLFANSPACRRVSLGASPPIKTVSAQSCSASTKASTNWSTTTTSSVPSCSASVCPGRCGRSEGDVRPQRRGRASRLCPRSGLRRPRTGTNKVRPHGTADQAHTQEPTPSTHAAQHTGRRCTVG